MVAVVTWCGDASVVLVCYSLLVTWLMLWVTCDWIPTAWYASVGQVSGAAYWRRMLSLLTGQITQSHAYCIIVALLNW